MKFFGINLAQMLLRYYAMMLVVIVAGFIGQWWLALLAFPIFIGTMMGLSFKKDDKAPQKGKIIRLEDSTTLKKAM